MALGIPDPPLVVVDVETAGVPHPASTANEERAATTVNAVRTLQRRVMHPIGAPPL